MQVLYNTKRTIGARITVARKRKRLTQKALARALGLSGPSAVNNYEKGRTLPRGPSLQKLAQVLGVTTDYLLAPDDPKMQVAEAPVPYGDLEEGDKRVLDDVAELLRAGDDAARSDLKRALDLVRRAAQLPRKWA